MDLTGAEIGVFEVWGLIGSGGMSRVWLARHRELLSPVVIKTLLATPEGVTPSVSLRTEAQLMARIPTSRVVRAVDTGVWGGCAYLAQEYVDGLDLDELCRRRRQALGVALPLWYVCKAVSDVADALHSAHQTGVLHRDVKPSNIFAAPQTGVRLGDFGIAVARGATGASSSGTPHFAAPETLRGERSTRRSDVYSLGATAFNLRYGAPPFVQAEDILSQGGARFPPPPTPEEAYFQHVVRRMIEVDPNRRYSSVVAPRRLFSALAASQRPTLHATPLGVGVYQLGPVRVSCELGDLAEAAADGIVNAANDEMHMPAGVGAALLKKGGSVIEEEALRGGKRALGECIATTGGELACKVVLHAVSAWKETSCIARTCQRVFLLAEELGLRSLAIPALGTGLAGVSAEASAYAMGSALYWHVLLGGSRLTDVRFVLWDEATLELFVEELDGIFLGEEAHRDEAVERAGPGEHVGAGRTLYVPIARKD